VQCIKSHHLVHQEWCRSQATHGGQHRNLAVCTAGRLKMDAAPRVPLPPPVPSCLQLAEHEDESVAALRGQRRHRPSVVHGHVTHGAQEGTSPPIESENRLLLR